MRGLPILLLFMLILLAGCVPAREAANQNIAQIRQTFPDMSFDNAMACKKGRPWVGMSGRMVRYCMGTPMEINTTTTQYGSRQQWIYGLLGDRTYIYVENGKVTAVQN